MAARTVSRSSRETASERPRIVNDESPGRMYAAGEDHDAIRLRGLIVVLWRAGLRISEALALTESDLDLHRGAILVRRGKAASAAKSGWTAGHGSR